MNWPEAIVIIFSAWAIIITLLIVAWFWHLALKSKDLALTIKQEIVASQRQKEQQS